MVPPTIEELLQDPAFRAKFLELLDRDPAFREEVRRRLLTEELLNVPERVERMRKGMDKGFRRVWRALRRNAQQIAALTKRMERVEAQIAALTEEMRELRRTVGQIQERWGLVHEEIAEDRVPRFLEQGGHRVRRRVVVQWDEEADLVLKVEGVGGRRFTLVAEVKGRVWGRRPFEQVLERMADEGFRGWMRREGFPEPVVPAVFGMMVYAGAEGIARELKVGLYEARRGEIVAPPIVSEFR